MRISLVVSRTSGSDRHFGASSQFNVVTTLNINGTSTGACSDYRSYSCAFATTRYCSNDCADSRTDRRSLYGLIRLITLTNSTFIVNANNVAIWHANTFKYAGESIAASIA
jgi:hypothetical protein